MAELEKVITALEFCTDTKHVETCFGKCPYAVADDDYRCRDMKLDALALLKEQQPKTARWEKRTGMMPPEYHGHYWCSNCDWHGKYNEREKDYKFCPACGAKMENPTST